MVDPLAAEDLYAPTYDFYIITHMSFPVGISYICYLHFRLNITNGVLMCESCDDALEHDSDDSNGTQCYSMLVKCDVCFY